MFTKKHASIILEEGGGTAIATFEDVGDFSVSGLQENSAAAVRILNRGSFEGYVEGDDEEITGSFSVRIARETLTDNSNFRPLDAVFGTGSIAALTTDNPIADGPRSYEMIYSITDGTASAAITFTNVRLSASIDESGDTLMLQISFTAAGFMDVT